MKLGLVTYQIAKDWAHDSRLGGVAIVMATFAEDARLAWNIALEEWTQYLKASATNRGENRLRFAIAATHMATASLLRGEYLRACRYAQIARRELCARGIPEHWWITMNECVAGMAIGLGLWVGARRGRQLGQGARVVGEQELTKLLQPQIASLTVIRDACDGGASMPCHPWRLAEAHLALACLHAANVRTEMAEPNSQRREEVNGHFERALSVAHRYGHRIAVADTLELWAEFVGQYDVDSGRQFLLESCAITSGLELAAPCLRRCLKLASLEIELARNAKSEGTRGGLYKHSREHIEAARQWEARIECLDMTKSNTAIREVMDELQSALGPGKRSPGEWEFRNEDRCSIDPRRRGEIVRKSFRYAWRCPVRLSTNRGEVFWGECLDVSTGGLRCVMAGEETDELRTRLRDRLATGGEGEMVDVIEDGDGGLTVAVGRAGCEHRVVKARYFDLDDDPVLHRIVPPRGDGFVEAFTWGLAVAVDPKNPIVALSLPSVLEMQSG